MIRERISQFLTYSAKQIHISQGNSLLGRPNAETGAAEEIIVGDGLEFDGTTLKSTGTGVSAFDGLSDKASVDLPAVNTPLGAALAARQPLAAALTAYAANQTTAITTALQGVEADPARIGKEYMPPNLEVDYIEVADSTPAGIPANTFGRKGSVPYFGSTPIAIGGSIVVNNSHLSTGSPSRKLIATIPIDAAAMVASSKILDFRLSIGHGSGAGEWAIWFDFSEGVDTNSGVGLIVQPLSWAQYNMIGLIAVADGGGGVLGLDAAITGPTYVDAAGASGVAAPFADWRNDTYAVAATSAASVANSVKVYIQDIGATASEVCAVTGSISISELP